MKHVPRAIKDLLVAAGLFLLLSVSAAGQVPSIASLPENLPEATRSALTQRRSALSERRADLQGRVAAHNRKCGRVPENSPLIDVCEGEQQALNNARDRYAADVRQFNADLARLAASVRPKSREELQSAIDGLRARIREDEQAIGRLGFKQRGSDLAEWTSLAETARTEFEQEATEAVIDVLLEGGSEAANRAARSLASLNPVTANAMIGDLQAAGVTDPYLFDAVRAIANTAGKPAQAQALKRFLAVAKTAASSARDSRNRLIVLGRAISGYDPATSLLLADGRFTAASLYNYGARQVSLAQVKSLTALNERQLKALQSLSKVLEQHVRELKEAERQQAGSPP